MNQKHIWNVIAVAVALAFVLPGSAVFANIETIGVTSNLAGNTMLVVLTHPESYPCIGGHWILRHYDWEGNLTGTESVRIERENGNVTIFSGEEILSNGTIVKNNLPYPQNHTEYILECSDFRGLGVGIIFIYNELYLETEMPLCESCNPSTFTREYIYVDDSNTAGPWDGTIDYPYQYIQDGIDNASDGDTVFVYNGTYYENVIVHKSINLIGEDDVITIIDGMHIGDPLWINTSFVNVCGFTVTNSSEDGWSQGICVVDKKWHGPEDPYITLTDITISGCIVEYNDCGIRLDNTRNVEIADCVIRNNSGLSVYNIYSSHVCIHHCTMERNGNTVGMRSGGIMVCKNPDLGDSEDVEIFNCTITGNVFAGISISGGSSQVNVHHNEICGNPEKGVFVSSSSAPTYNVSIHDNDIFENEGEGSSAGGICLQDCIGSVRIEKNQISSNTRGVYLLRSSGTIIIDNNFTINGCGINLDGSSDNFIDMNTILSNNGEGISLSYSNDNIISRNDISSNVLAGISFHSSNGNTIYGNTLIKSSYGIFFEYCSNDNHVVDNVISNSEYGIYFCDSHSNYIDNNSISNNNGGIRVCYSIDNILFDNVIADNTEGICFYDCVDNCIYHNVFYNNSKRNAFFYMLCFSIRSNRWDGNQWDRPRLSPYPIFGRIGWNLLIPWVNIDWHPWS